MIRPGEVYIADFDRSGPHPVIVVSREMLNRGREILVVFCTSARFSTRRNLPNCVPFRAGEFGFVVDCVAQCENMLLVDSSLLRLDDGPIGLLNDSAMRNIIKAIGYVFESDCEPI